MNHLIPIDWLKAILDNVISLACAIFVSIIGYLLPIKDIVHLVIFFFLLDVLFGYLAARKLRHECFRVKVIWEHTIPRMLISIVVILMAFMWDTVFNQDFISSYKIIGWFICGVLIYSIVENGYAITKWNILHSIGAIVQRKVKNETGEDIEYDKTKAVNEP